MNRCYSLRVFSFRFPSLLGLSVLGIAFLCMYSPGICAEITGDLLQWHKVVILLDGPDVEESPATFRDYRLNVTFTKGAQKFVIPGHYAADGNAGRTGARAGNKWRAQLHYRSGPDLNFCGDDEPGLRFEGYLALGGGRAIYGHEQGHFKRSHGRHDEHF